MLIDTLCKLESIVSGIHVHLGHTKENKILKIVRNFNKQTDDSEHKMKITTMQQYFKHAVNDYDYTLR